MASRLSPQFPSAVVNVIFSEYCCIAVPIFHELLLYAEAWPRISVWPLYSLTAAVLAQGEGGSTFASNPPKTFWFRDDWEPILSTLFEEHPGDPCRRNCMRLRWLSAHRAKLQKACSSV
mmetsp:Transcript_24122/g.38249  ORF Transcript_24122/g.38249 Transcript_24122/m.38249 type:complete len:119 (-) Transcript_24122:412-768(-)